LDRSSGIHYPDYNGNYYKFTEDHYFILEFKDKTETFYLREIAEELGIQKLPSMRDQPENLEVTFL
jgi:hypothetical protein